jgi:hypothetical protein
MTALVDHRLHEAGLEHRARFVASGNDAVDDLIDIVEVEGGVPASICQRGRRFGVRRYHHDDDGEVAASGDCGWFDTPAEAAAQVVELLRRAGAA